MNIVYADPGTYGSVYQPQPQQDNSAQILASILPVIMTLPAIQAGEVNSKALSAELAAIPVPAVANASPPTKVEFDALRDYTVKVEAALAKHVDTASTVYAAQRQQVMLSLLTGLLTSQGSAAGSNQTMLLAVVMMVMFLR